MSFDIPYGHDFEDDGSVVEPEGESDVVRRHVRLTVAASIRPRPVRWTWQHRIPLGEVTLTPGKGGVGKSTFHAWTIAHLTRGTLDGAHYGEPKPCIIAASEDSWERTIVPRLIVAGADMAMVYRVDVVTEADQQTSLTLPADCDGLEAEIARVGAVLLSVDPLMSTISGVIDTHKDRDVRQVLEPLARLADRTGCTVLGNAHFNKSAGADPMSLIMGSAAFGNVARAALGFAQDTEADDGSCVISQVKNNLGRLDLPSLRYRIDEAVVDTDEGPAFVGKLVMLGESDRSVSDILRDSRQSGAGDDGEDGHTPAQRFILRYIDEHQDENGEVFTRDLIRDAEPAGYGEKDLTKARFRCKKPRIHTRKVGKADGWAWSIDRQDSTEDSQDSGRGRLASWESSPESSGNVTPLRSRITLCSVCGEPMDAALALTGDTTHPGCGDVS